MLFFAITTEPIVNGATWTLTGGLSGVFALIVGAIVGFIVFALIFKIFHL